MEIYKADVVIVGGGGAGLRAAIAVAESDPALTGKKSEKAQKVKKRKSELMLKVKF